MDKFKVTGDGTHNGVKILAPNGDDITSTVRSYSIRHDAGRLPILTLEIVKPEIDVTCFSYDSRQFIATGK